MTNMLYVLKWINKKKILLVTNGEYFIQKINWGMKFYKTRTLIFCIYESEILFINNYLTVQY